MSQELLYGMFGVHGYTLKKTVIDEGNLYLQVEPQAHRVCCSNCGDREVVRRGSVGRLFRSLPIGSKLSYVLAQIPRVACQTCGLVRQIRIGFADPRKHYTRAYEKFVLQLCRLMTIQDVAEFLDVPWDTVKDIEKAHLERHYANPPLKNVEYLAIDEICVGRSRKFMTLVMDLESGAILFAAEGKKGSVLQPFWRRLKKSVAKVKAVSIDLGAAYLKAVERNLPEATIVWDHFHVIQLMNRKLTQLRRDLYRQAVDDLQKDVLKGTRWLLLADPEKLDPLKGEPQRLREALKLNESLSVAYYLKESLRQLWKKANKQEARKALQHWYQLAIASGVRIIQEFARRLLTNQDKLLAWYDHPISSGPMEATNNKIKTMQRTRYGLRDKRYFILKLFQLHEKKYALIG